VLYITIHIYIYILLAINNFLKVAKIISCGIYDSKDRGANG
jgi:hypothetical protein